MDPALLALAEMLWNARRALAYAQRGGLHWYDDELIVDAVANRVREVTEAAKYRFPGARQREFPALPWREMIRTREIFTHHYRRVDPAWMRRIVERSLPRLVAELEKLGLPDLDQSGG